MVTCVHLYVTGRIYRRASTGRGTCFGFFAMHAQSTTGFYFFLPARDVIELQISPDDAAKLIVSCGVIQRTPTRHRGNRQEARACSGISPAPDGKRDEPRSG